MHFISIRSEIFVRFAQCAFIVNFRVHYFVIERTILCDVKIDVNMCEPHYVNLFCCVDLLHSPAVWLVDIWNPFDNLTSFDILTHTTKTTSACHRAIFYWGILTERVITLKSAHKNYYKLYLFTSYVFKQVYKCLPRIKKIRKIFGKTFQNWPKVQGHVCYSEGNSA